MHNSITTKQFKMINDRGNSDAIQANRVLYIMPI